MKRKRGVFEPSEEKVDKKEEFFHSIRIENFNKTQQHTRIRKLLKPIEEKLELSKLDKYQSFRKKHHSRTLFLRFLSHEAASKALPIVSEHNPNWDVSIERNAKRRRIFDKSKSESERKERSVEEATTPLFKMEYSEQLKKKEFESSQQYKHLFYKIRKERRKEDWEPKKEVKKEELPEVKNSEIAAPPSSTEEETKKEISFQEPQQQQKQKLQQKEEEGDEENSHPKKKKKRTKAGGPFFGTFFPIVPSPLINGYRNNCEFTCGQDREHKPSVGFLVGNFKDGFNVVENPDNCKHISEISKEIRRRFETFVRKTSLEKKWDCYSKENHSGVWRALRIRENEKGEVLLQIQINEENEKVKQEDEEMKKAILGYFVNTTNPSSFMNVKFQIKGIQVQYHGGISNAAAEDSRIDLIYGDDFIITTLTIQQQQGKEAPTSLSFKISGNSFFQINTKGCESLYSIVAQWLTEIKRKNGDDEKEKKVCLLDVCCGTGTIGQLLSSYADKVIGIDISHSSIEDAKENMKRNNIQNVEYHCGPAEKVIKNVILNNKNQFDTFLAIVDPPRMGLHKKVVQALRACEKIGDIIYVSCNVKTMVPNVVNFCKSSTKTYTGKMFTPFKYQPVDMFPHCNHCENIMHLTRDL